MRSVLLGTTALVTLGLSSAIANPQGPNVAAGAASVSGLGTSQVTITQTSQRAVIDWRTFNIGAGETTRFIQPNASAIALNRVTGGLGPSTIYGNLTANGRVFLINPYGILIGGGAVIDTASFLASTNDIKNSDFMAGRYNFTIPGRPDASIVNLGTINAGHMGFAALVAPGVRNAGTITANFGKVSLASGNTFSLDFYGDSLIKLSVSDSIASSVKDVATGQTLGSLVKNEGKLKANGGQVQLSAVAARKVVGSVINNSGVLEARTIGRHNGKIVLGGPAASTKVAGAPTQTVKVSGKLDVSGKGRNSKGGTIQVIGENIEIAAATFDASGAVRGGTVLIGGDVGGGHGNAAVASIPQAKLEAGPIPNATTVSIDAATTINASATRVGDAGKVVVWSDGTTNFTGAIKATGGPQGGNGGFVEVSGKQVLTFDGQVNLAAPHGQRGTLLLDPLDAKIDTISGDGNITVGAIQLALLFGDVLVTTQGTVGSQSGDITVAAPITWGTGNVLALSAHRNIAVNANITSTGGGGVLLLAGGDGSGIGTVTFGGGAKISTSGDVAIAFNPSVNPAGSVVNSTSYVSPVENFSGNVIGGGTLTQFMLVNTPADLQNVGNNLTANYVLGRDIDMSGVVGFVPIGNGTAFTGKFNGQSSYMISNLTFSSAASSVGLFSKIGIGGSVTGIFVSNINITSTATGAADVGILAGSNSGEIDDVHVQNSSITLASGSSTRVGGLVGFNSISTSLIDTANVSTAINANAASNVQAGGIAGVNNGGLHNSTYVGDLQGGTGSLGGVVGVNNSNISNVSASGTLNVGAITSGTADLGGIAGINSSGSIINAVALSSVTALATGGTINVGGIAGTNAAFINQSYSRGNVAAGSVAVAGGIAGSNTSAGSVAESYATGTIAGAIVGGVFGNNAASPGTTNVYWNTTVSGVAVGHGSGNATTATGLTTSSLLTTMPTGFGSSWQYTSGFNSNFPHQTWETASSGGGGIHTILRPSRSAIADLDEENLLLHVLDYLADRFDRIGVLIALNMPDPPAAPPGAEPGNRPGGPGTPGGATPSFAPPPVLRPVAGPEGERFSSLPPVGETRFFNNEVLLQVSSSLPPDQLEALAREVGLTVIATQSLGSAGRTAFRFQLRSGMNVRQAIRLLESKSIVAVAQPNYQYQLVQPAGAAVGTRGDPSQYMMGKLYLDEAHRLATGNGVTIAVIDSEADKRHSELAGVISNEFNAVGAGQKAHAHGTAMVGAIASRDRLLGVAPNARILAVRAFGETATSAEGTSFNILKGIEWAVSQGARVINMSFAGPHDPSLERALKAARDKGVVLVAAAGNAGPASKPLFPGADPSVIAVTATDSDDRLFRQANRGAYVSVASPGVEILAPAPDEAYQMSTGTSIATAHVSGVIALMLERDPTLTPADVKLILETTATDLGPKGRDVQFGWGLVNPQKALAAVDARKKTPTAAATPR